MYHYSGLVVRCRPLTTDACARQLAGCPGIDVYVTDPRTGRIVVVLETETPELQEVGLRRVQSLPLVLAAHLVYHGLEGIDPDERKLHEIDRAGSRTSSLQVPDDSDELRSKESS